MATRKITITLDAGKLEEIRALVRTGSSKSVSSFVQHAVTVSLGDAAGWAALLSEALDETGGQLTKAERKWADGILRRRRRAA